MKNFSLKAAVVLSVVVSAAGAAWSQSSKAILAGTVRDQAGAVVANAKVTVTSEDTGETRTLTTTSLGAFRAEGINPGLYEIRVEGAGFAAQDVKDLRVAPSIVTSYDPILSIGQVSSAVTVEAVSNLINTTNGQLSGTIDGLELSKVPIFSLNPYELVAELPGVQAINPALNLGSTAGNYEQLTINGARPRSNNYMLDSQDINDVGIGGQSFNPVVPDFFETTTALLNSSSAEYGRSGGAVVNLITKSGTNDFHGTVFELYQGSGLNALDGVTREGKPFPAGTPVPKARYDQHNFGFTAGGPIIKDKLFAFGGAQWERYYGNSSSSQIELPDAGGYAELTSIGKVNATTATQVALLQGLLNNGSYLQSYQVVGSSNPLKVSAANCPGGTATCSVTTAEFQRPPVPQQEPDTQWMARVDYIPTSKDTLSYRYLHDRESFTPDLGLNTSGLPGFDGEVGGPTELAEGTWTHIFTSNLTNELRGSEVRLSDLFAPTPQTLANPEAQVFNVTLSGSGLPELGVSQNIPQGRKQELYQVQDAVGWTKGRNSIRFGFDIGRDLEIDLVAQNALGGLTFAAGGGASSLDNFLYNRLGTSGQATKSFGGTRVDPHLWKLAGFVQDDIKLSSEFTLNVGLRYDYDTNPQNSLQYPAVDVNNPYAPITTVIPVQPDYNNLGPRLGFAFNPHEGIFADGKTVFHGGIGVFYDTDFTNLVINGAQTAPNVFSGTATSTAAGGLTNATGQIALLAPTISAQSTVESVAKNLVNPLTYQYNFGVERELPGQIKLTANYVGARGEKLFSNRQLNYFGGLGQGRLNPSRGAIIVRDNRADSEYNSAQVEVSRRFRQGLFFRAVYTYGKNLDDASEVFATFASPTSYSANLAGNGLGQDWGPSAWDRRQIAAFEYVYSPIGFHSGNHGMDIALGLLTRDWFISGTTQFATGPYSTYNFSGLDTNGDGSTANDRPVIGNPKAPITTAAIDGANLAAFGIPGGTQGVYYDMAALNDPNTDLVVDSPGSVHFLIPYGPAKGVGRNSFQNPGQSFWNVAVEKDLMAHIPHVENGRFVLRAECQNVGNHNNVSTLDINLLDVGTSSYLNKSNAREATYQSLRVWAKFLF